MPAEQDVDFAGIVAVARVGIGRADEQVIVTVAIEIERIQRAEVVAGRDATYYESGTAVAGKQVCFWRNSRKPICLLQTAGTAAPDS